MLDLQPTPANIKFAEKKMAQIRVEIGADVFAYSRHFPNSPEGRATDAIWTFGTYADHWLSTFVGELGTAKMYASSINKVWKPALGQLPLKEVRHSNIAAVVSSRRAEVSGKSINNDLIPLRAVFEVAIADRLIDQSPALQIRNLRHQSSTPDPFTPSEVATILADLEARAPVQVWAYYLFAFSTGLRPSEQIIARWAKIDWTTRALRIDIAKTRGQEKGTKTHSVRDVELSDLAMQALAAMKPFTFLRGPDEPIFCHPATGRPWGNDQYQRITYFHPTLKRCGIRSRDAYQARHTYATTALMAGVNPAYIARQLGHSNTIMLFKAYSRWIDGADRGREADKLNAAQLANSPPVLPRTVVDR